MSNAIYAAAEHDDLEFLKSPFAASEGRNINLDHLFYKAISRTHDLWAPYLFELRVDVDYYDTTDKGTALLISARRCSSEK